MCFRQRYCFCCIRLDVACKVIGMFYMVLTAGMTVLYGVPAALGGELPLSRIYFYFAMCASSIALFVAALLLVIGSFTRKPRLLTPWLATAMSVSAPLMALSVVGMVTIPLRADDLATIAEESAVISVYFSHASFLFYFFSVVRSYKRELEDQEDPKAFERLTCHTLGVQYRDHV